MKMLSIKTCVTFVTSVFFALSLLMPVAYGHDRDKGHHWGFDKGHHWGHFKGKGKRKGHSKERNPWYWYYSEKDDDDDGSTVPTGVDLSLTVMDLAYNPGNQVSVTVNSLTTVQGLLEMVMNGASTNGYFLQECFATVDPRTGASVDNCDVDEMPMPLDGNLSLEGAGVVDGDVLYLVYMG